jgi:SAM-dependent methyltransferase
MRAVSTGGWPCSRASSTVTVAIGFVRAPGATSWKSRLGPVVTCTCTQQACNSRVSTSASPWLTLRERERSRWARAVDPKLADAEALPFDDETFDCVVCTLSLCCIPDDRQAAREMWRVLPPGGTLLLLDHVRSHTRLGLMIQHALERNRQGEYYTRRPLDYLAEVGFEISEVRSTRRGWVECVSARKPVTSSPDSL